jgi:hypothetical protein
MTKFKTETSLKTEHADTLLSDTELNAVSGGAGGLSTPPSKPPSKPPALLPPQHGPTDPRQW